MRYDRLSNIFVSSLAGLLCLGPQGCVAEDWEGDSLPPENCDVPDYAYVVGGGSSSKGSAFCASKFHQGTMIKVLEIQGDGHSVRTVRVTFTDNEVREFGDTWDPEQTDRTGTIQINPQEEDLVRMEMWDNGFINLWYKNAVGGVLIKTSNGQSIGKMRSIDREGGFVVNPPSSLPSLFARLQ